MSETSALSDLGEPAEESAWRALVEAGLKGASAERLVKRTSDGIAIQPLYTEKNFPTATDVSGFPGAAPFVRGNAQKAWEIRQRFTHPDPERTNHDILADLAGGVSSIELVIDPNGEHGVAVRDAADLDLALADVILEAAPVSLDAGAFGLWATELLAAKLKGATGAGVAFNIDPIGALMRTGAMGSDDVKNAARSAVRLHHEMPAATAIRVDARPVHEAGGTEAQELGAALAIGIAYLRALTEAGLSAGEANASLCFTLSVGPDVLVEAAKLRALRLCWARVLEASGAEPAARGAYVHAFTARRMMTRYDAWTNIVRVSTAAFAAAIGGADAISTLPFTDALGLPTPFARRVARNTQHVLLEEAHLAHVADPAGGAWFVEKLTRDLAEAAWAKMQSYESAGGILASLTHDILQEEVAEARAKRMQAIAIRRETITGITDFPLLDAEAPAVEKITWRASKPAPAAPKVDTRTEPLALICWAEPFEALRDRAERTGASVFFSNIGSPTEFGPRAGFSRNLFAAGGIGAIDPDAQYTNLDTLTDAFRTSSAKAAVLCSTDAVYAERAADAARALKAAGARWVILAGKPQDEAALRAAGVDQFIFAGDDALIALTRVHQALGLT